MKRDEARKALIKSVYREVRQDQSPQLKAFVENYWGTPCREYAPNCGLCQAWLVYRVAPIIMEALMSKEESDAN